jgi:hypothetical protein
LTKKQKLIEKAKNNLNKTNAFDEHDQFVDELFKKLIPYLNVEGLNILIKQTDDIIEQIKRTPNIINPGWTLKDLE